MNYSGNSINYYNNIVEKKVKKGLKIGSNFLKNSKFTIDNTAILGIRDLVLPNLKFKPWGAIKLAEGLNRGIPLIGATLGIGIELWDSYSDYKKQEEFKKIIQKTVSNFEDQRKEYIELINDNPRFLKTFFKSFLESKEQAKKLQNEITEKKRFKKDFEEWRQKGLDLEIEFVEMLQENNII